MNLEDSNCLKRRLRRTSLSSMRTAFTHVDLSLRITLRGAGKKRLTSNRLVGGSLEQREGHKEFPNNRIRGPDEPPFFYLMNSNLRIT